MFYLIILKCVPEVVAVIWLVVLLKEQFYQTVLSNGLEITGQ